jgi:DTW domain-containing protein YfiP
MHLSLCVCSLIPRIETRTRLLLVIHRVEDRKTTNTGRLASECLVNSQVVVRGHAASTNEPLPLPLHARAVLLFPAPDAVPLDHLAPRLTSDGPPLTLVVPDGNWRQASKVRKRIPGLQDMPCVMLPTSEKSTYRLRSEAHEHGLATIEAIARAFGILEGRWVQEALELPFRAMVERTLWARGSIATSDVTSTIPKGAMRHNPARCGAEFSKAQNDVPRTRGHLVVTDGCDVAVPELTGLVGTPAADSTRRQYGAGVPSACGDLRDVSSNIDIPQAGRCLVTGDVDATIAEKPGRRDYGTR